MSEQRCCVRVREHMIAWRRGSHAAGRDARGALGRKSISHCASAASQQTATMPRDTGTPPRGFVLCTGSSFLSVIQLGDSSSPYDRFQASGDACFCSFSLLTRRTMGRHGELPLDPDVKITTTPNGWHPRSWRV
ncbi:hypothetical protein PsYK624_140980 [Phanerochaete sordida]|uniref:Uncharacterized protein n=1 Tax=Phanerochaete sordida TaxID=48140 RepID=A0A9P3GNB0_9APHY|nr:hypothetical protein PsYK624_140980 [Phanerochaete sordida]